MDLIFTDKSGEDVGVLLDYSFDLAIGSDENDFELTMDTSAHCMEAGCLVYAEGCEYGGMVDNIQVSTANHEIKYTGRTWHGILDSKVLEPDTGEDYLICSGEANAVLGTLIDRMGLSDMFEADSTATEITIGNYKMNRYITGYKGICKMLKSEGAKLKLSFSGGKVVLSAIPVIDYTEEDEFDNDQTEMDIKKYYNPVNHVICLGKGDLKDREVIHLYADENGNISEIQTFTGLQEVTQVYDYSSVESTEELRNGGIEIIEEAWKQTETSLDFDAKTDDFEIGDIVGAKDNITGVSIKAEIVKKIVTINKGKINIEYKVGE